ncbi:MAG: NFACT family protein [Sandaracinus sp.]|nr:NFACT family protein [Sandaracinus sp.]
MGDPPDSRDLGRVQRVDGPSAESIVLGLYHPTLGRRVLVFDAKAGRCAWAAERPTGAAADGFVKRLRNLLVGAATLRVEARGSRRRLWLRTRSGEEVVLTDHEHAPVLRRALDGFPLAGRRRFGTEPLESDWTPTEPLPHDAPTVPAATKDPSRELRRRIADAKRRIDRKIRAIESDAARASKVASLRSDASFVLANLAAATPGSPTLVALDTSTDPPAPRTVALDPARDARAHAERLFHEARRLERGAVLAEERLAAAAAERDALLALEVALDEGQPLEEVEARLESRPTRPRSRDPKAPRRPYREFLGAGDRRIHVGRSARDNDTLTTSARPHDRWLHARGRRGAHVVVPLAKGETCSAELLLDAALLAAHFSEAHADERVEIQHADRRHVHKRRGSALGAVTVTHDKTLLLRADADRLRWLLSRER